MPKYQLSIDRDFDNCLAGIAYGLHTTKSDVIRKAIQTLAYLVAETRDGQGVAIVKGTKIVNRVEIG